MDVTCPKEPDICFRFAMKKTPLWRCFFV
jgi:hypothetical protein